MYFGPKNIGAFHSLLINLTNISRMRMFQNLFADVDSHM